MNNKVIAGLAVAALSCSSALVHGQSMSAATLDAAELAKKRDALIAQCPARPVLSDADAATLPINATRWGGEGPRVVLIHGGVQGRLGGGPATFEKQEAWGRDGFQVERVERPGFGQSPTRGVDDMERDAVWIADRLGDGAHLIGHSWGGAEALLAAARRPNAVLSLVLVEPAVAAIAEADPALRDSPAVRAGAQQRANVLMTVKTPAEYGAVFSAVLGAAGPVNAASGSTSAALGSDPEEATRVGCALLEGRIAPVPVLRQAIDTVAKSGIPVLIVTGGWNPAFDAAGEVLARLLQGRHIIVRSPSHFVQLANFGDFNREVGAFMREADRNRAVAAKR